MSPRIDPEDNSAYEEYSSSAPTAPEPPKDIPHITNALGDPIPLPITKQFRDANGNCVARDVVTIYFKDIIRVTQPRNVDKGALLLEVMHPEDLYPIEAWLPKKLCSNFEYDPDKVALGQNTVKVWRPFAEDKLEELYGD